MFRDLPPCADSCSSCSSSRASSATVAVAGVSAKTLASPAVLSVPTRSVVCLLPNALSDVLFCLPALSALRESFPGAHLSVVARVGLVPLVRAARLVDEVLERPRGGLSAQAGLLLKLHAHKPDIAVAFSSGRNAALLAWSSGAPVRAGFEESKMEALFNHRLKRNGPPRVEAFLELVRSLGCKTPHLDYCGLLDPGPEANLQAQRLLDEHGVEGRFVIVAPTRAAPTRVPPAMTRRSTAPAPQMWARTVQELATCWPVILIGSASPSLMAKARGNEAKLAHPIVDLSGRADLLAQAALCAKSALLIAEDGGLLHLASAMHTPVVGIYEPGPSSRPEPRGPRRILHAEPTLGPAQVLAQAHDLIGL